MPLVAVLSARGARTDGARHACLKASDVLFQKHYVGELVPRPSETVENYLYFFLIAYLIVYTRRIRELERKAGVKR